MKVLTLAQFILACSLSSEPDVEDTLYRVVMATSQGHPHWIQTHDGHLYTPENQERAERMLSGLLGVPGARVHVGVAALPSQRLMKQTLEPERALDACTNIGLASLELEPLLGKKTRKDIQAYHEALATYYAPGEPESLEALSFGARVLAIEDVDVREEAERDDPMPGPTFTLSRSMFYEEGTPLQQEEPTHEPVVPESQPASVQTTKEETTTSQKEGI